MNDSNKSKLLELMETIAPGRGTAENEIDSEDQFLQNFLPVPKYQEILQENILLIVGGRGVGKTQLFRLLDLPSGRQILIDDLKIKSFPPLEQTTWIAGFGRTKKTGKTFPVPETVEKVMQRATNIEWRSFWIGLMLGVILQQEQFILKNFLVQELGQSLSNALANKLSYLSDWFSLVNRDFERISNIIDELDEKLLAANHNLFVTYDELDRLVPSHAALAAPIRELLALWLDRWRRWDRIHPKIFLRTDLFREEFLGFPDASKLQGHQLKLEWQHDWLYQLLVKRLANSGEEMCAYLNEIEGLIFPTSTKLGWNARLDANMFEELIEKMIGKYMGSSPRKGFTYRWIPNHLQDAGGRIAPRSFLKLFSLAAANQQSKSTSETSNLLQPSDLQGALMDTSEDRIKELAQEEYPWLESLKTTLTGQRVPMPKDTFLNLIKETKWDDNKLPPSEKPEGIFQYLLQLGVIDTRSDGRINIPEIYLYGFQVKRHGGVKRPK
jgi:hypothetical protein